MSQRKFSNAKIVVLGGSGVGKTAFTVRYITRRYIGDYDRNKEMMYTHTISTGRDDITLELLDTASDCDDEEMEKHIKWGDGFVLIYSVTDRHSLYSAQHTKEKLFQLKNPDFPVVVVANKCDLLSAREVTEDDGQELAAQLDCLKIEISVAEGFKGVSEVMDELLFQLKREFVKNLTTNSAGFEKHRSRLSSMKRAFKKRIARSHSDTF